MSGITLEIRENADWPDNGSDAVNVVDLNESRVGNQEYVLRNRRGFFRFITELRRRKVCRATTAYCIALWLTCQVVEVISEPLGLPNWTLEMVIVLGLVCFPIALILSWLFEVTPNGLKLDNNSGSRGAVSSTDSPRSRFDQVIDCSLLLVAVAIGAQLALTSIASNMQASPVRSEEIYVSAFPVVAESGAEAFSSALQVELQYELSQLPTVKVVVPSGSKMFTKGSSLTGSVSVTDKEVQVTALVVSNQTGELAWSGVLTFSKNEFGSTPRSIARGIVTALESWSSNKTASGG